MQRSWIFCISLTSWAARSGCNAKILSVWLLQNMNTLLYCYKEQTSALFFYESVILLTCWPQADFKAWNLTTLPLLKAYSVSISHCLSVFLKDSNTGCISWQKKKINNPTACIMHWSLWKAVRQCSLWNWGMVRIRKGLTSSPKLYTPSPSSPASPSVNALSCFSVSENVKTKHREQVYAEFKGHILINVKHLIAFFCLHNTK